MTGLEGLRRAWRRLTRLEQVAFAGALAVFLARVATLGWSAFGFYQGWGEASYSLLARGFLEDPLVPGRYPGEVYYRIPPLQGYLVAASTLVLGASEFASRLPSVVGGLVSAAGVYALARGTHDRRVAGLSTLLYATLPWTVLWAGRAKPDAQLLAGITWGAVGLVHRDRGRWVLPAGMAALVWAGFAKQPAALFVVAAAAWIACADWPGSEKRSTAARAAGWLLLAGTPLLAWAAVQLSLHPDVFVADLVYQASRPSFMNLPRILLVGFVVGASPLPLLLATYEGARMRLRRGSLLVWWVLVYGVFAVAKSPVAHDHYTWPLMPPLAILAAAGLYRAADEAGDRLDVGSARLAGAAAAVLVATTLVGAVLVLGVSGDLGNRNEARAAAAVTAYAGDHPDERVGVVVNKLVTAQMTYYEPRLTFQPDTPDGLAGWRYDPPIDVPELRNRTAGADHVLLVTWNDPLPEPLRDRPVLEDTRYEFLVQEQRMRVVEWR